VAIGRINSPHAFGAAWFDDAAMFPIVGGQRCAIKAVIEPGVAGRPRLVLDDRGGPFFGLMAVTLIGVRYQHPRRCLALRDHERCR
jgi:hypothetical protein